MITTLMTLPRTAALGPRGLAKRRPPKEVLIIGPLALQRSRERNRRLFRRATVRFSDSVYEQLNPLMQERGQSLGDMVRLGLGMLRLAVTTAKEGNRLVIVTPEGEALQEVIV
jgi:hypothetical protein